MPWNLLAGGFLSGLLIATSLASEQIVASGAIWSYDESGVEPVPSWRLLEFDAGLWPSGPSPLGFGNGDEATVLNPGSDPLTAPVTYYARHVFVACNIAPSSPFVLRFRRDDGCAIYLNGEEVARSNLPSGELSASTLATSEAWGVEETIWHELELPANLVAEGANVLAVEIHQDRVSSNDLAFDLELIQSRLDVVGPEPGTTIEGGTATLALRFAGCDGVSGLRVGGRVAPPPDEGFTIVALPDTQQYWTAPEVFLSQTTWIRDQIELASRSIAFVTHLGDLVEHADSLVEWQNADAAMSVLDGVVPYGVLPGNHDQWGSLYDQFFYPERYEHEPWYGGHYGTRNRNNYQLITVSGVDLLLLHLEFCPEPEVVAWARGVLSAAPERRAIVVVHGLVTKTGARSVSGCPSTQYLWDDLVVPSENVVLVLCGHSSGEYHAVHTVDRRPVVEMLACYQTIPALENGFLRLLDFSPRDDRLHASTYSPWLDASRREPGSKFDVELTLLPYATLADVAEIGPGEAITVEWADLEADREYQWMVEGFDAEGRRFRAGPWTFRTPVQIATPAEISDLRVDVLSSVEVAVSWYTDQPASGSVSYGPESDPSSVATSSVEPVKEHTVRLSALVPQTRYLVRARSITGAGLETISDGLAFSTGGPEPPASWAFHRGDANADGVLNLTDVLAVLNLITLQSPELPCYEAANANDDAFVDVSDAVFLLRWSFAAGPPPPAPGPPGSPCGGDPEESPSDLGCALGAAPCR